MFNPIDAADAIMGGDATRGLPMTDFERQVENEIWHAWLNLALAAQREDFLLGQPIEFD